MTDLACISFLNVYHFVYAVLLFCGGRLRAGYTLFKLSSSKRGGGRARLMNERAIERVYMVINTLIMLAVYYIRYILVL